MKLRIIHVWTSDGVEHVFAFLVLDPGIEFKYVSETDAAALLDVTMGRVAPPQLWPA